VGWDGTWVGPRPERPFCNETINLAPNWKPQGCLELVFLCPHGVAMSSHQSPPCCYLSCCWGPGLSVTTASKFFLLLLKSVFQTATRVLWLQTVLLPSVLQSLHSTNRQQSHHSMALKLSHSLIPTCLFTFMSLHSLPCKLCPSSTTWLRSPWTTSALSFCLSYPLRLSHPTPRILPIIQGQGQAVLCEVFPSLPMRPNFSISLILAFLFMNLS